jgi:predicted GIY-YIG superfamily endonuclease
MWYCYLIYSETKNRTYIGFTTDLQNRIKQHNGILPGGAKATKCANDWKYMKVIETNDKKSALSLEWYWKNKKNSKGKWQKTSGLNNRINRGDELINQNHYIYKDYLISNT